MSMAIDFLLLSFSVLTALCQASSALNTTMCERMPVGYWWGTNRERRRIWTCFTCRIFQRNLSFTFIRNKVFPRQAHCCYPAREKKKKRPSFCLLHLFLHYFLSHSFLHREQPVSLPGEKEAACSKRVWLYNTAPYLKEKRAADAEQMRNEVRGWEEGEESLWQRRYSGWGWRVEKAGREAEKKMELKRCCIFNINESLHG